MMTSWCGPHLPLMTQPSAESPRVVLEGSSEISQHPRTMIALPGTLYAAVPVAQQHSRGIYATCLGLCLLCVSCQCEAACANLPLTPHIYAGAFLFWGFVCSSKMGEYGYRRSGPGPCRFDNGVHRGDKVRKGGNDVRVSSTSTSNGAQGCALACKNAAGCTSFEYDQRRSTCNLFEFPPKQSIYWKGVHGWDRKGFGTLTFPLAIFFACVLAVRMPQGILGLYI